MLLLINFLSVDIGNPIKYPKGIPYLVDCNVTGSNPGTATVPCFPLKLLWEHSILPAIQAMVAPGGPCEGAQWYVSGGQRRASY